MGRTMPFDCPGCGKVLDWGDFGPSGNDPDQAKLDKPQCTCRGWEWNGEWWEAVSTTNPTAETLPNPRRHALETTDYRIHALCTRHDITVEGIVALVDEVFSPDNDSWLATWHASALRRLARGEEA